MENSSEIYQKVCRNCQALLPEDAIYCPKCSQKYTTGKIPIGVFVREFFSELFNLDSKVFKTIFALFIPGKLTTEYFQGKHKSFGSPLRIFLLTAIVLFAVVSYKTSDLDIDIDEGNFISTAERIEAIENLDSIKQVIGEQYNSLIVNEALDSLFIIFNNIEGVESDSSNIDNAIDFSGNKSYEVADKDIAKLDLEALADKYEVNDAFDRYFFKQQIKVLKDGRSLFQYFIGKLTLMVLFMMPFLALILKLLYIRRDFYYVEHLIFSFHYHAFVFLITTLLIFVGKYLSGWIAVPIVGIFVYQFIAMKRVYTQSYFKTFLKFLVLNFLYIFLATIFFSLTVLISFVLF